MSNNNQASRHVNDLREFYYSVFNPNPEPYIIQGDYAVKVPIYTDTHLLLSEPGNRQKYLPKQMSLLYNLDDFATANNINVQIHAGDVWDRGEETHNMIYHNHMINAMETTFGRRTSYVLKGNHEETYSKYNLFYAHTEILSEELRRKLLKEDIILPNEALFKATDKISFGDVVDIHFMHFDKDKKYYIPPSNRFTIAVFHEDLLTLESKDKVYHHTKGMGIDLEKTNIADNVDVIVCGHIHTPMMPYRLNNARKTLVIVPGSLCQRTRAETHTKVDIPVVCITPTGQVTIEFAPFQLGPIVDTINVEVDTKNTKQRQMQKEVKKYKDKSDKARNFMEFLESLDPEDRRIIDMADNEIMPIAVAKYLSNKY